MEVKVIANSGRVATVLVPFVDKLRIDPNQVELAHTPKVRTEIVPDKFHPYRIVRDGSTDRLYVDGPLKIETDQVDTGTWKERWTPTVSSLQQLAAGAPANWPGVFLPS